MSEPTPSDPKKANFKTIDPQTLSVFRTTKPPYLLSQKEYECPELDVNDTGTNLVDTQHCESFGLGTGCKHIKICKAYGGKTK